MPYKLLAISESIRHRSLLVTVTTRTDKRGEVTTYFHCTPREKTVKLDIQEGDIVLVQLKRGCKDYYEDLKSLTPGGVFTINRCYKNICQSEYRIQFRDSDSPRVSCFYNHSDFLFIELIERPLYPKKFRVKSLDYGFHFGTESLQVGCETILVKDALLIADKILKVYRWAR